MNPYASAQQAYTESSVLTAPPGKLVVMLYDGAIRFLNVALWAPLGLLKSSQVAECGKAPSEKR